MLLLRLLAALDGGMRILWGMVLMGHAATVGANMMLLRMPADTVEAC